MYTYIRKFFGKAQDRILLGRWERTDRTINKIKIDWANTDHCGTCAYTSVPARSMKEQVALGKPSFVKGPLKPSNTDSS